MSAVLDSLGHGARMIPPANELPRAHDIHLQKPSPRTVGDIRVVSVPQFVIPQEVWAPPCRGLEGYFEVPASERISGIVVDLRGNEGGLLDAPVCLVSIFIKPNVEIFETADTKRRYGSRSVRVGEHGHTPLAYPLAIFVDKTTDEGALMAAAILQDQRRARIIGEIKSEIAGSVCTLFRTDKDQDIFLLPVGQLLLPGGRPLATAIRLDVLVPAHDDAALIDAARAQFALARETQP
jgi:carboxyl-terminal processing protease